MHIKSRFFYHNIALMWKFLFFYNVMVAVCKYDYWRLLDSRTRSRRLARSNVTVAPVWCTRTLLGFLFGARKNKHWTQYCVRTRLSRVHQPWCTRSHIWYAKTWIVVFARINYLKKKKKLEIYCFLVEKKGIPSIISLQRGYVELFLCLGENFEPKAINSSINTR